MQFFSITSDKHYNLLNQQQQKPSFVIPDLKLQLIKLVHQMRLHPY